MSDHGEEAGQATPCSPSSQPSIRKRKTLRSLRSRSSSGLSCRSRTTSRSVKFFDPGCSQDLQGTGEEETLNSPTVCSPPSILQSPNTKRATFCLDPVADSEESGSVQPSFATVKDRIPTGLPSGLVSFSMDDVDEYEPDSDLGSSDEDVDGAPLKSRAGGVLIDFLQRINDKKRKELDRIAEQKEKDSCPDNVRAAMVDASKNSALALCLKHQQKICGKLLDPHCYAGWTGYEEAAHLVNEELLFVTVMEDITTFFKVAQHPAWRFNINNFLQRAAEIRKSQHESRCLQFQVENWLFRHRILHCRPEDSETPEERHGRTQQLWSQLHEGGWKVEVPAMKHPFKDDVRKRLFGEGDPDDSGLRPKSAGSVARCLSNLKARPSSAGSVGNCCDMRKEASILQDLDWKRRSCRSKASAGTWDWSHGSLGHYSLGTPSCLSRGRSLTDYSQPPSNAHWSSTLFHVSDDVLQDYDEDYKERSKKPERPILSKAITSISKHPVAIKQAKSVSLPNLRKFTTTTALHNHVPRAKQASSTKRTPEKVLSLQTSSNNSVRLPSAGSVRQPWHSRGPTPVLKCEDAPMKQYLRACLQNHNVPIPLPFITGHSSKLDAGGQMLCDQDLLNITVALDDLSLSDVDLANNPHLTEKSLVQFMQVLSESPTSASLEHLSLKRCVHASKLTVMMNINELLNKGVPNLRHLDLTDVTLGIRCHLPFAKAARDHPRLHSLTLCNTGLGLAQGRESKEFIHYLLGGNVEVMDLSWNSMNAEFFSYLGARLVQNNRLHWLSLCSCATAVPKELAGTTIVYFLYHLARDESLKFLDISTNHIDFCSALVLEDALMHCKNLKELNISNNPLGVVGLRSLLRLLCHNASGLKLFSCENCFAGKLTEPRDANQMFRAANPGGRYVLQLHRPYHRALLRMLCKTADRFGCPPEKAFSNIVYSRPPWVHPIKDEQGIFKLPAQASAGEFAATFSVDAALHKEMKGYLDSDYNFEAYLDRHFHLMLSAPCLAKLVPLFAQWKSVKGHVLQQLSMLDALSKDFILRYAQIVQMTKSDMSVGNILERLLTTVEGGQAARFLTLELHYGMQELVSTMKTCSHFLNFNVQNPNGHYNLNLSVHSQYAVAERLLLLDRWESGLSLKRGRTDISQKGDHSVIRNPEFMNQPLTVSMVEWHMPVCDSLELDYSSTRRPPAKAKALDDLTLSNILMTLQLSGCTVKSQIAVLRMASHHMFLTSKQLRLCFGVYGKEEYYAELVVIFLNQIVDIENQKMFRVRIEDEALLYELGRRLGFVTMFTFMQPEQSRFTLDFADREHRIVTNLLMIISKSEDTWNLRNPVYILANGQRDPLPQGVPRAWEKLEEIPTGGHLSLTYTCAPELRNFKKRKELLENYLCWPISARVGADVMWWASLKDVPADVLLFLDFVLVKYGNLMDAFRAIDGEGGNGVLSLREFEEGYKGMGCHKFAGPQELERVRFLFRWLDPSGEGTVSKPEFMIFDQILREVQLSIEEFVEFCVRTFGDELEEAFLFLDADHSGEIDKTEWKDACKSIGYLGPCMSIFSYCDKDDEGTISMDEFLCLEKFQKPSEDQQD